MFTLPTSLVPTVSLTLVAVLLTSCISYPRRPYSHPQRDTVSTISVIPILPPEEVRIINADSMTAAFGLLGQAIESSIEEGRNQELRQRAGDLRGALATALSDAVLAALRSEGYTAVVEGQQPTPLSPVDFEYDYASVETRADAILHVWFFDALANGSAGYSHHQAADVYMPRIFVCARLVNAKDGSESYFQAFSYGPDFQVENIEYVPVPPAYAFSTSDELLSQAPLAVEGLLEGTTEIGARIGRALAP